MAVASAAFAPDRSQAYKAVLWGGLLAGVFDITYACVSQALRGRGPVWTLQSVASGWLGANAFRGGLGAAALGLVSHFLIAFVAAAVYYAASRKLRFLVRHAVVCGLLYGILVFLFMSYGVVSLSAAPFRFPFTFAVLLRGFISHALLVGLPIALAVRRYAK